MQIDASYRLHFSLLSLLAQAAASHDIFHYALGQAEFHEYASSSMARRCFALLYIFAPYARFSFQRAYAADGQRH